MQLRYTYAAAVQAAAGQRLSYFVVSSSEIAGDAIRLLKREKPREASFIPLKDMQVKQTPEAKGHPLIEHVKFDKKYENAFMYIFSNTYITESIETAKRTGIGSHRFVTLGGEPSNSGHNNRRIYARCAIAFGARIKAQEIRRRERIGKRWDCRAERKCGFHKKNNRLAQTKEINHNMEMKHLQQHLEKLSGPSKRRRRS